MMESPPLTPSLTPTKLKSPRLTCIMPPNRDYAQIITQTKVVYDLLLSEKQDRLIEKLVLKKNEFDAKCNELARTDEQKAIELAVMAQETLNKMNRESNAKLKALHCDYQAKLNQMCDEYEANWMAQKFLGGDKKVECKVYPHK